MKSRQSQIARVKSQALYLDYINSVPKKYRKDYHPQTPDASEPDFTAETWQKSYRKWSEQVRDWRNLGNNTEKEKHRRAMEDREAFFKMGFDRDTVKKISTKFIRYSLGLY